MKKKLALSFVSIFLYMLVGAHTAPLKPSVAEEGKVFYLFNIGKNGYLVGGNKWGTQASIATDHAYKIVLQKWLDKEGSWDGETYLLKDSVEAGDYRHSFLNVFIEKDGDVFVDQNTLDPMLYPTQSTRDRDCLWTVKPKEPGSLIYIIQPSAHNQTFHSPQLFLCARNLPSTLLPVVGLWENENGSATEWMFVQPKEADIFIKNRAEERQRKKKEIIQRLINSFSQRNIPVEDTVYLYNPVFEKFLIGENQFKSQASLSSEDAYKVVVQKYLDQNKQWDGKTYYITDSVKSGNFPGSFRNVFIEKDGLVWVDQTEKSSQRDCLWEIIPSGSMSGAFNIRPSKHNRLFNPDNLPEMWLGSIDFYDRDYPIVSLVMGRNDGNATDWMFLSKDQRDQVFGAYSRERLQELIFIISDAFPQYETSSFQLLCDDIDSSSSQIEKAIGSLRLMLLSGGKPDNEETSFTQLLLSPDFTWPGGRGWNAAYDLQLGSINWFGGDRLNNPCAEAWQSEYDFYQELKGVPKGLFRIDMQAFSRPRGIDMAWIERDTSFISPVIYANEMVMPIQNLLHTTFPNKEQFDFLKDRNISFNENTASLQMMDGSFVLNNQMAASLALYHGYYDQSVYCFTNDGVIKAGIRDGHKRTGAWTVWDNLRITYLPETIGNYVDAVNCHLKKAIELEQLANVKKIDSKSLSRTIKETQLLLKEPDVNRLRNMLLLINDEITRTRKLLETQEFGHAESQAIYTYSQKLEEDEDEETRQRKEKRTNEQDNIKRRSDDAESYYYFASMLEKQDEKLALNHLQTSFDRFLDIPADSTGYLSYDACNVMDACIVGLSSKYEEHQQYEKAVEVWKRTVDYQKVSKRYDADTKLVQAYCELGHIFMRLKDYPSAVESYKYGTAIADSLYEEARKNNYEYSVMTNKELFSATLNHLSYALAYQKKYAEALQTIEHAIENHPDEPNYYDSKGEILYMSGDLDGAREMWNQVIRLDPDFARKNDSTLYKYLYKN